MTDDDESAARTAARQNHDEYLRSNINDDGDSLPWVLIGALLTVAGIVAVLA